MLEGLRQPLGRVPGADRLPWSTRLLAAGLILAPFVFGVGVLGMLAWQGERDAPTALGVFLGLGALILLIFAAAMLGGRLFRSLKREPLEKALEKTVWWGLFFDTIILFVYLGAVLSDLRALYFMDMIILVAALLDPAFSSVRLLRTARKLRRFPAQNATPVVVALRGYYGPGREQRPET
jgi:hypothetical protein